MCLLNKMVIKFLLMFSLILLVINVLAKHMKPKLYFAYNPKRIYLNNSTSIEFIIYPKIKKENVYLALQKNDAGDFNYQNILKFKSCTYKEFKWNVTTDLSINSITANLNWNYIIHTNEFIYDQNQKIGFKFYLSSYPFKIY
jgi:hypothetical protein